MRGWLLLLALLLAGCDEPHMIRQAKPKPFRAPAAAPADTVAEGDLVREDALAHPPPLDRALMQRGRERFTIFCAPCHGAAGTGRGVIVTRGMPAPPSFLEERLRQASTRHLVEVIGRGYGVMYGYGDRLDPVDRWAVAAYIRALQQQGAGS
jgi:mono/diheme cytochrome c family protein